MIVVADSSPLVALVNIEQVDILPKLFGSVLVPPTVLAELSNPRRPASVRAFAADRPSWLEVRAPRAPEHIPGLHAGEEAALNLAVEVNADLILIDEKDGRRIAAERHLLVAGTVGVLERAADEGLLDLRNAFGRLEATDFWVSPSLLTTRLEAFEKRHGRSRSPKPGLGR